MIHSAFYKMKENKFKIIYVIIDEKEREKGEMKNVKEILLLFNWKLKRKREETT